MDTMSHAAPTLCMKEPRSATTLAARIRRNRETRRGFKAACGRASMTDLRSPLPVLMARHGLIREEVIRLRFPAKRRPLPPSHGTACFSAGPAEGGYAG